jgi:hypothetical protein
MTTTYVTLFKAFAIAMADYIERHNANYTAIESALNDLYGKILAACGGQVQVPDGLAEVFDRRGLIGIGSYDFNEGTLAGPNYYLPVAAGAYFDGAAFYHRATTVNLSMAGKSAGTYYVNLDSLGNPVLATSPNNTTTRQFSWNDTTHAVSAKALHTGVNVLFDGDDYADCLTSAARSKTFTKLADRLEEIELLLGKTVQTPASSDTITIDWSKGSHARITLDRPTTTINMSGAYDSQKCTLELIQDAVGGRAVAFGANVEPGSDFTLPAALSTGANKVDFLGFLYSAGNSKFNYVSLSRGY